MHAAGEELGAAREMWLTPGVFSEKKYKFWGCVLYLCVFWVKNYAI